MTSSSLSIKRKHYLANSLKSYWWLMLINTILFFLTGPVALTMVMNSYKQKKKFTQKKIDWFYI